MDDSMSLGEAREWLRDRVEDGARCPCCRQLAKVYKRKINAGMARALIEQYRVAELNLVHTRRLWLPFSKEVAQLQWWGLIEQTPERREDGGQSGWWRVTRQGQLFVMDMVRVPKYARVYDGQLRGLDDRESWSIRDALGTRFDYQELMGGI